MRRGASKEFKSEDSATSLSTVKGDGVSVVAMGRRRWNSFSRS